MFFNRKTKPMPEEPWVLDLIQRIVLIERAQRALNDVQVEIEDKHSRLRGVVYGRKLHKQPLVDPGEPTEEPQVPRSTDGMTKDQVRKFLATSGRFIPGKPTNHQE